MTNIKDLTQIKKRDGRIVDFNYEKIIKAISKALKVSGEGSEKNAIELAEKINQKLKQKFRSGGIPDIELIQDFVQKELILSDYPKTTKAYILYRIEREKIRNKTLIIPEQIKKLSDESKQYFKNPLGEFVYYRTYSRWIEKDSRRETWLETIDRYMNFMKENLEDKLSDTEYKEIKDAILNLEVMPSMRLLWSAGKAARKNNATAYNCSYISPTELQDFGEILFLLSSGVGVGFSVEENNIHELPKIKKQIGEKLNTFRIEDSKEGWADALVFGMKTWFSGKDIEFDFSKLRPAGTRLKTMGGRSSGPAPLKDCLNFVRNKILSKQSKRLSSLDVHDIICKIGEIIVSGGVRRSALISLSSLEDQEMKNAKTGRFWMTEPQRAMANNSAVFLEKPSTEKFLDEWLSLVKSQTGERGIFNRGSLERTLPKRRTRLNKEYLDSMGLNPCGEIILRNKQFCNLTEVVARSNDTIESLLKKIKIATILGTYQSTLSDFPYLSREWKRNCEEERLLGLSITGQWDCDLIRSSDILNRLKEEALKFNKEYSKKFGINESSAITCIKPSGTLGLVVDAAPGIHPRYSKYYIRRVRISANDPLFKMMKDQKVPYNPETGQTDGSATTYVLEFPIKSPVNSVTRNDLTAIQQLEYWKMVKVNYTEHNPSVTIYVNDNEWIEVGNWVYQNFEIIGGLSFLPKENHIYSLAPYEEITEEKYNELIKTFPDVDYSKILIYEKEDETKGSKELACSSGVCEI